MRSRFFILSVLAVAVLAAVVVPSSVFTVDRTEFVYRTMFGRHVATYDGADDAQAGLHFKWPWPVESVQRLDRRLQYFDLSGAELLTRDPKRKTIDKTLTIDAFVCWRIADADSVDQFIRKVGTPEGARDLLSRRVSSDLGAAIGEKELSDLITTDPVKVDDQRKRLRDRLLHGKGKGDTASLQETAREKYGIEVVDVRVRRTNHPPAVQEAIFSRIRSQRETKAADYQSEGTRLAADIRSNAEREASEMRAAAEAEAIRLRGQADAEADHIRNEAAAKDPQFYTFLKRLEEYQRILGDNKSMLLLSTHRELFDTLFNPPTPGKGPGAKPDGPQVKKNGGQ